MGSPKKVEFAPTHLEPIDSEAPTTATATTTQQHHQQQQQAHQHSGSGAWDTETDYILSYFLGGDGAGSSSAGAPPLPTAATDFASSSRHDPHSSETLQSLRVQHHSNTAAAAAASASPKDDDQTWSEMPPPTPAVQFYSHTPQTSNVHGNVHHYSSHTGTSTVYSSTNRGTCNPQQSQQSGHHKSNPQYPDRPKSSATPPQYPQHPTQHLPPITSTSQSSSASSLSSVAAALIAGAGPGGVLYNTSNNHYHQQSHHQQHQQQQQHIQRVASQTSVGSTPPTESPISPAAMIGLGYENLLLPPPGGPIAATTMPPSNHEFSNTNSMSQQQQQHLFSRQQQQTNPILPTSVASLHNPHSGLTLQQHQHQQQFLYAAAAAHAAATSQRPVESEEKRAKRLERNRESARKSRRRKKERLAKLGGQVKQLQSQIATERQRHIHDMVPALSACRTRELAALLNSNNDNNNSSTDETAQQDLLARIVRGSGPSSQIMRSVLDFQYTTLKQMTLPSYQKLLLWFTLRDESYFLAGKEQYAAKQEQLAALEGGTGFGPGETTATTAPGQAKPATKVSSKLIGDEMLNGPGGSKAKIPGSNKGKNKRQESAENNNDDGSKNPTAKAYDAARCWPLFCFELKFSVEQEERFLATHRQIVAGEAMLATDQQQPPLAKRRSQMAAAVHTTESLGKAVGSLGHVVAQREEKAYLGILRPCQVARYQAWLETNRDRVRACAGSGDGAGDSSMVGANTTTRTSAAVNSSSNHEVTLQDICRRLNEVLQISAQTNSSSVDMNC